MLRLIRPGMQTQTCTYHHSSNNCAAVHGPLPFNEFMPTDAIITKSTGCQDKLSEVPTARKSKVFLLVDSNCNVMRRDNNQHAEFRDDCGVWVHGTSTSYYIKAENGGLITLTKSRGQYYTSRRIDGKKPMSHNLKHLRYNILHQHYAQLES